MSGENAVTKSKVTRPEAQLRRQADELDERAQKAQEDFRPAQYAEYDEGVEGRTLPPRKLSYPNRGADRMQKKGAAVDMLANQAGVGGSGAPIMMTIDERDIEAADHARKNANIARYKNWLDTVGGGTRGRGKQKKSSLPMNRQLKALYDAHTPSAGRPSTSGARRKPRGSKR